MKKPIILLFTGLLLLFCSCMRDEEVELGADATTITIEKEEDHAIDPGGRIQVNATYVEANKEFEEAVFEWSTEHDEIATVDNKGLVTAQKAGFTTVFASAYGFKSQKLMIQVVEDTNDVVISEIIPEKNAILLTETIRLSTSSQNINGTATSSTNVDWKSETPTIAEVDNTGLVTPLTPGNAKFVAIVDGVDTDTIEIAIGTDASAPATLEISGSAPLLMENETMSLSSDVKNFNGDILANSNVIWSSSDASLATVSSNGLVTAIAEGNVTITATFEGLSDSYDLLIMNPVSQFRTGTLKRIDYDTDGTFMLELTTDNKLKLNFIDFDSPDVLRLPGVVAYLANNIESVSEATSSGLKVGPIPQSSGNFTIDIDNSLDPTTDFTKFSHVFIICEPFSVPYAGGAIVD